MGTRWGETAANAGSDHEVCEPTWTRGVGKILIRVGEAEGRTPDPAK